jgi:hypothetical protein
MIIKTTYDIHTHQPVYAICNVDHQCTMITTSILYAIQAGQCKSQDQVHQFLQSKK